MGGASSAHDVKLQNIGLMSAEQGYDVTIVCCSDVQQAIYWNSRLEAAKGAAVPSESTVVAVDEDWPGGAGNFFGTLYAWQKACARLKADAGRDLVAELQGGKSVAIFHTAGKGTRLAPLPGSENNNKPAVQLPAPGLPSVLESVIRQTGAYAQSRRGRLSVFWGDQIFIPSVSATYEPKHHADILCALGPMPTEEEWAARQLEKYGCIVAQEDGTVIAQLEKVTHAQATAQLQNLEGVARVGCSLGSFSLSAAFLASLESGFAEELAQKSGKMDSDPHLWMPITLNADSYAALMVQKELFSDEAARAHHARISEIGAKFKEGTDGFGLFGSVDAGLEMSWWDFGMLKLYRKNVLLLTEDSDEATLARTFFGVKRDGSEAPEGESLPAGIADEASVVSGSRILAGSVKKSSVAGVVSEEVEADGAVLVNVCARRIVAPPGSVAYNLVDESPFGIVLGENEVRVGVFMVNEKGPAGQEVVAHSVLSAGFRSHTMKRSYFEMRSNASETDGGKVFKERVHGNAWSFQEVYDMNMGVDVSACAAAAKEARQKFAESLGSEAKAPAAEGEAQARVEAAQGESEAKGEAEATA